MDTAFFITLAIGFVLLNAFFVVAEFSIVKIRHTRVLTLKQEGGLQGKILAKIHDQLDAYLSACQLGITLASLGLGWVGEPSFAKALQPIFSMIAINSEETQKLLSLGVAFGIISYLHIVIGELMPKSMAIRQTERLSLWTATPLYLFYWLMYPAIWLLNISANFLLKLFQLNRVHPTSLSYSTEEIKLILRASHRYGEFDKSELELLTKSLVFTDLEIADVMRPLSEMVTLDINARSEENIEKIMQQRYSRYPVFQNELTNYIGVLHVKDLFSVIFNEEKKINLKSLVRPILKVKENEYLLDVFHQFRQGKPHFAIVYSGTKPIGFVTLDNLLQAIIGEIKDEFHITKEDWLSLDDGTFIIKGSASLFTLASLLNSELPASKANTVSGLILEKLESFPSEGEKIEFDQFNMVVKKIRGSKILQVRIYPKKVLK